MNGVARLWLSLILVLVVVAATYVFYRIEVAHHREVEEVDREAVLLQAVESAPGTSEERVTIHLFRANPRNPGILEESEIEQLLALPKDVEARIERIAAATLPQFADDLPSRASVRKAYLLDDGTAVVDFSREISQQLGGGITTEFALLQTVARTLTRNQRGVQRVRFLVEGQERPTLSGHVSIQVPFM